MAVLGSPVWIILSAIDISAANVLTPAVTIRPPSAILTPVLAVTIPTESILVTSSYVSKPVKVAATPVMFLTAMSGVPINPVELPVTIPVNQVAFISPPTSRVVVGMELLIPTLLLVPSTTNVLVSAISASVTALVIMLRLFFYL